MFRLSLFALLALHALGEQVFLSVEQTTCTDDMRGNGSCDPICLTTVGNDGGDCNRKQWCDTKADNGVCEPECFDFERSTNDCICTQALLTNDKCDVQCMDLNVEIRHCHCSIAQEGDNKCQVGCMRAYWNYDLGDCYKPFEKV